MDINKIFQAKVFKGVILGIIISISLLAVFKVGMMIGARKADFSCRWSDNYHLNFGGPRGGFMGGFGDRDFIEANGTFGQIIKIDGETLIVKSRDDVEKVVLVGNQTVIKSLRENIKLSDLKVDDYIITIGEPNSSGQIEAKLIRLMPSPETSVAPPFPAHPLLKI